jgi:hypothetical protein
MLRCAYMDKSERVEVLAGEAVSQLVDWYALDGIEELKLNYACKHALIAFSRAYASEGSVALGVEAFVEYINTRVTLLEGEQNTHYELIVAATKALGEKVLWIGKAFAIQSSVSEGERYRTQRK